MSLESERSVNSDQDNWIFQLGFTDKTNKNVNVTTLLTWTHVMVFLIYSSFTSFLFCFALLFLNVCNVFYTYLQDLKFLKCHLWILKINIISITVVEELISKQVVLPFENNTTRNQSSIVVHPTSEEEILNITIMIFIILQKKTAT